MKKQTQHVWRPVTVKDEKDVWVDFVCGHYAIAQGFADDEKGWSLFFRGKWIKDFAKLSDAKKHGEQLMDQEEGA